MPKSTKKNLMIYEWMDFLFNSFVSAEFVNNMLGSAGICVVLGRIR